MSANPLDYIRISDATTVVHTHVAGGSMIITQLVPANPNRILLRIQNDILPPGDRISVGATVDPGQLGQQLPAFGAYIEVSSFLHGAAVTSAWFGFKFTAGGWCVLVMEVFKIPGA